MLLPFLLDFLQPCLSREDWQYVDKYSFPIGCRLLCQTFHHQIHMVLLVKDVHCLLNVHEGLVVLYFQSHHGVLALLGDRVVPEVLVILEYHRFQVVPVVLVTLGLKHYILF